MVTLGTEEGNWSELHAPGLLSTKDGKSLLDKSEGSRDSHKDAFDRAYSGGSEHVAEASPFMAAIADLGSVVVLDHRGNRGARYPHLFR